MHWDHRVGRRLKLRDLNILLAVADAGSMAKAAKRLAISQPAVSRAVADMEHTLGAPLFDRSPQGIEPTQYGRALIHRGLAVFEELKQGVQDIEFLSDPATGELRVGASAAMIEGIITTVIDRLSRRYPRVRFHLVIITNPGMYDDLRMRRVELACGRLYGPSVEPDMDLTLLAEEPLAVVAGVNNPLVRRRKVTLAELVDELWTWPTEGSYFESLVQDAFRASGIAPPRATVYSDPFHARIRLAATGRFLAVVPASGLNFSALGSLIKRVPVELAATERPIGIVTLKKRTLSPLAQLFIKTAREITQPSPKAK
jgi:DNA-binding transcriptional LysR family regulator